MSTKRKAKIKEFKIEHFDNVMAEFSRLAIDYNFRQNSDYKFLSLKKIDLDEKKKKKPVYVKNAAGKKIEKKEAWYEILEEAFAQILTNKLAGKDLSEVKYKKSFLMYPNLRTKRSRVPQEYLLGLSNWGTKKPVAEAEILFLSHLFHKKVKNDVQFIVNTLGCENCFEPYKETLSDYFVQNKHSLCAKCEKLIEKKPWKIFECTEIDCGMVSQNAPHFVDHLCKRCRKSFISFLEIMDEIEVPYVLSPTMFSGVGVLKGIVFELRSTAEKPQLLGIGGRIATSFFDEDKEKRDSAVVYFERFIPTDLRIKKHSRSKPVNSDIYFAQLSELAKKKAFLFYEKLREKKFKIASNFVVDDLRTQLEEAGRKKAKLCLILGHKEVLDGTILCRNMYSGMQEVIREEKMEEMLKKKLKKLKEYIKETGGKRENALKELEELGSGAEKKVKS